MRYICRSCQGGFGEPPIPFARINDLANRLQTGDVVPNGQCPDCGGFVHEAGRFATHQEVSYARAMYHCQGLEIDSDARASHADEHAWVQAWVYVPHSVKG